MDLRLPWHQGQWSQLCRSRAANRLPHALLLQGRQGLGKRYFAQRLVGALVCQQPNADGDACGECRGCRLFQAGNHPDTLQVSPEGPGKLIKVDQVRHLTAFLERTTEFGGAKVVSLAAAEQMNINAANSLLKTLEEPAPGSLLLLISAHPRRLPATVRSRCQQLNFHPPAVEEALPWLSPQLAGNADPALLLRLAQGAPLEALELGDPDRWQRRQQLFQLFCDMVAGRKGPLEQSSAWLGGDVAENLGWLVHWHMDLIRLKMDPDPAGLRNPDLREPLSGLSRVFPVAVLFRQLDAVTRLRALSAGQVNMPLQMEAFLAQYPLAQRHRTPGG